MQLMGYEGFSKLMLTLYSDMRMRIATTVYKSKMPVTKEHISDQLGSSFWRKMPHKLKPVLSEMEQIGLVSQTDGGRYSRGDILVPVMRTVRMYPLINKLRGGDSKNSDLTEERILLYIRSNGKSSVSEIQNHLGASERAYSTAISNLRRLELINNASYGNVRFRIARRADKASLTADQLTLYEMAEEKDGSPVTGAEMLKKVSAGVYDRCGGDLVSMGIFSREKGVNMYGLTRAGGSLADALKRMRDSFEEKKKDGIDWNRLAETVRKQRMNS